MEQFANNAQTTLPAALSSSSTTITFAAAPRFPSGPQFRILVSDSVNGNEYMLVTAVTSAGKVWTVTRGIEGTSAVAHAAGRTVTGTLTAGALGTLRVGAMFNVRDYGAVGTGGTDDTKAIQAALADAAIQGGTVYLPNGTYSVTETPLTSSVCLSVPSNTILLGESRNGAIIRLAGGQNPSVRPITVQTPLTGGGFAAASDVAIQCLTIDGNLNGQAADEHRAGIFVGANASRIYLADMSIHDNTGDAVDIYQGVQNVVMERCFCYDNGRNAVSINQGSQQYLSFRDCQFFRNAGQFSTEVSSTGVPAVNDLTIDGCFIDANSPPGNGSFVLSIEGTPGYLASNVRVTNCVINGSVNVVNAAAVTIADNTISTGSSDTLAPLIVQDNCVSIMVLNNKISIVPQTVVGQAQTCIAIADSASNISIIGNTCVSNWNAAHCVELLYASSAYIIGNVFQAYPGTNTSFGVYLVENNGLVTIDSCIIANNYFRDPQYAVNVSINDLGNCLVICGNVIEKIANSNLTAAFVLSTGSSNIPQVSVFDNELVGVSAGFSTYPNAAMLISGVRGSGGTYSCSGSPNGQIVEIVGAIALQRDGTPGHTLYVKESGTGNIGWVSK